MKFLQNIKKVYSKDPRKFGLLIILILSFGVIFIIAFGEDLVIPGLDCMTILGIPMFCGGGGGGDTVPSDPIAWISGMGNKLDLTPVSEDSSHYMYYELPFTLKYTDVDSDLVWVYAELHISGDYYGIWDVNGYLLQEYLYNPYDVYYIFGSGGKSISATNSKEYPLEYTGISLYRYYTTRSAELFNMYPDFFGCDMKFVLKAKDSRGIVTSATSNFYDIGYVMPEGDGMYSPASDRVYYIPDDYDYTVPTVAPPDIPDDTTDLPPPTTQEREEEGTEGIEENFQFQDLVRFEIPFGCSFIVVPLILVYYRRWKQKKRGKKIND
jgi:hypothetical protein